MKQKLLLALLFSIANWVQAQNYTIEDKLLNCILENGKVAGIDVLNEYKKFEAHLMVKGVLKDNSGKSYYAIYERLAAEKDIMVLSDYSLPDTLRKQLKIEHINNCNELGRKLKKSKTFKNSKLYLLNKSFDSLQYERDVHVGMLGEKIMRILAPADFEHDYYKMATLGFLSLSLRLEPETGLARIELPNEEHTSEQINPRNIVSIKLKNHADSVFFNDTLIRIESLRDKIKPYIKGSPNNSSLPEAEELSIPTLGKCWVSKCRIHFTTQRNTLYKTYIATQDQLMQAYADLRNDLAIEKFGIAFDELDGNSKDKIRKAIPQRISEAEPSAQ